MAVLAFGVSAATAMTAIEHTNPATLAPNMYRENVFIRGLDIIVFPFN
jgi:hypothetical protein